LFDPENSYGVRGNLQICHVISGFSPRFANLQRCFQVWMAIWKSSPAFADLFAGERKPNRGGLRSVFS
jgi:hypothetical protein